MSIQRIFRASPGSAKVSLSVCRNAAIPLLWQLAMRLVEFFFVGYKGEVFFLCVVWDLPGYFEGFGEGVVGINELNF